VTAAQEKCSACGAPVRGATTERGERVQLDLEAPVYWIDPETGKCQRRDTTSYAVLHRAVCPIHATKRMRR